MGQRLLPPLSVAGPHPPSRPTHWCPHSLPSLSSPASPMRDLAPPFLGCRRPSALRRPPGPPPPVSLHAVWLQLAAPLFHSLFLEPPRPLPPLHRALVTALSVASSHRPSAEPSAPPPLFHPPQGLAVSRSRSCGILKKTHCHRGCFAGHRQRPSSGRSLSTRCRCQAPPGREPHRLSVTTTSSRRCGTSLFHCHHR
jgi:hypothetical protein